MNTIEEVKAYFANDQFASLTGIEITEADKGYSLCRMPLRPYHMNANHTPMGGAIFTLSDFAFAVAANIGTGDNRVVSQNMSISFLSTPKGTTLIAEAKCIRAGRRTSLYGVTVTDDLGTLVAHTTATGFVV